jgi:ribosomal protein S1
MESEDRKNFDPHYVPEPDAVASPELQRAWQSLQERYKVGDILTAKVVDIHNIGLIVEMNGIRGVLLLKFIRSVELDLNQEERRHNIASEETQMKLQEMKDKELSVKIIKLNAKRHQFILSQLF